MILSGYTLTSPLTYDQTYVYGGVPPTADTEIRSLVWAVP
jgi:hypothetical protein